MMRLIWIWDVMSPNSIRKMICNLWYHKLIAESLMKTEIGIRQTINMSLSNPNLNVKVTFLWILNNIS